MHPEPTRTLDPGDIATQPRALGKRVPKSTRRDDYSFLMYEYREMDGSRFGQNAVVQNHRRLQAKAPIDKVLNEYNGIPEQI